MQYRTEYDTLGPVKVPAGKYWGAQTQRSIENFNIGTPASMPAELIHAYGYVKKAAAMVNHKLGVLSEEKKEWISRVCDEIIAGELDDQQQGREGAGPDRQAAPQVRERADQGQGKQQDGE